MSTLPVRAEYSIAVKYQGLRMPEPGRFGVPGISLAIPAAAPQSSPPSHQVGACVGLVTRATGTGGHGRRPVRSPAVFLGASDGRLPIADMNCARLATLSREPVAWPPEAGAPTGCAIPNPHDSRGPTRHSGSEFSPRLSSSRSPECLLERRLLNQWIPRLPSCLYGATTTFAVAFPSGVERRAK